MRLAVVGSREFKNQGKVVTLLSRYRDFYGIDNLEVVSGGCPEGADFLARNVALDLGLTYVEFPPAHRPHNIHCVRPADEYNKPYHVSNFFVRNSQIAEYCEYLAAFTILGVKCNGTMDTFNKAKKLGKRCFLYEEK